MDYDRGMGCGENDKIVILVELDVRATFASFNFFNFKYTNSTDRKSVV